MNERSFLESLNEAVEGFLYVVKSERNMRIHFLIAFFVLLTAVFLGVGRIEWMMLCGAASLVLVAEMVNTAIEETVDLLKKEFDPAARIIKHVSAGAVLVAVVNSIVVGFFIFSRYWNDPFAAFVSRVRYAPEHVLFVSVAVSVFLVIAGKAFARRGTPLRGGPISGHTAVAFAFWTAVAVTHTSYPVIGGTFLLALFVAYMRVRSGIHSWVEVVAGAALGVSVTALFFKLFG
ncbi:MAG TPA: diacylglycerol kinase [Candidatus Eisenbacteria bacterium]|nr:diacylglycerol kinase [Candidatus Eisenbacteria bacterium]